MRKQRQERKLLFIERLVAAKAVSVFGSPHFWVILLLMLGLGYCYCCVINTLFDVYALLFCYPLLYAAVVYRLRGVIAGGLFFLAVLFCQALSVGGDALLLVRAGLFSAFAFVISGMLATLLNYSEAQLQMTGDLRRLSDGVAALAAERKKLLHFMNMAAHDMKAPLAAMQSYFRYILDGYSGEISRQQRQMVGRSDRRAADLCKLIGDLLDISRLETGRLEPEMSRFSLIDLIRSCLDEPRFLAGEKGLEFRTELPARLPEIYGSSSRLRQVINNLAGNAVRYTERGSVTVRAREEGGEIVVEIEDSGIGIPAADLPHIFEDFFRAGNAVAEGSGLGLGICRRIVAAHHGRIWADNPCPGRESGSRFTFTLPLNSEDAPRP